MTRWPVALAMSIVLLAAAAAPARAQMRCSYDDCALRVKTTFLSTSLVRGSDDVEVRGLGFLVSDLSPVFEGSPAAQEMAETFRRRNNTGKILTMAGAVLGVAALATFDWNTYEAGGTATGLLVGGAAVTLTGTIVAQTGRDHLHRAVWHYNRDVAR